MRTNSPGQSALLLLDVIDVLNSLKIPYAIIGAFAASFYGVVRASLDADAVISFENNPLKADEFKAALSNLGLEVKHRRGDMSDPIAAVIRAQDSYHNRVDLLVGIRGMEEAAFSRTTVTNFMGSPIRIVCLEDFIAMKIFAGSEMDLTDVKGVIHVSAEKIDLPLLKEAAAHFGKDILSKLESLLKEIL